MSPLTEALYGTDFQIDGKVVPIRKNVEVPEADDSNTNVVYRLVDRLLQENDAKRAGRDVEHETNDELYDTIRSNVIACKMFSSRYIGRCYITNKNYGENCPDIRGHVFPGAQTALGSRWFYSALPYHTSAEFLLPFADLCFHYSEYIVPVCIFPNMSKYSEGKNFIVVNVERSKGNVIQKGFIKTNNQSMVSYRVIEDKMLVHPSYAPDGAKIEPIVTVYFNYNGSDPLFNSMESEYPFTDCTKDVPVNSIIAHNPGLSDAFQIGDERIAGFHTAFEVSAMDAIDRM